LLPTADNLLLAHADRTRILTDEHRRRVCIGAVVERTVLVDGRVVGMWRITRAAGRSTLEIEPLTRLPDADLAATLQEGERRLGFAADTDTHDIRMLPPGGLPAGRSRRDGAAPG
jgi:hypothetical protein